MNESASRAWLPGAMVEVEIVKPILQTNAGEDARLFDLWVEVKEVFTGPQSIKGTYISINPHLAFRFPPSSWSAYGMGGIAGGSIKDFPPGRRGLLWIFQRSELLTGTGQGMEFRFFTGFTPVWMPREEDAADALEKWEETRSMMQILKTLEDLDDAGKSKAVSNLLQHPNAVVREWALAALARVKGVDSIPLLESAQKSELVSERIKEFLLGAGVSLQKPLGDHPPKISGDPSLRNLFLYDVAMSDTFGKLWAWDESRDLLMEKILSHPLANEEEAWLLHEILIRYWEFSGAAGTPEKWTRLAKAARENSSWKKEWIDPRCRRQFELSAWLCTWMASRATFDASPAIDYLLERWAIPDRDSDSTATYVDGRGAQLANSLPLKPEQAEKLRAALTVRLAASGEAPSPENLKNMMEGIRALTWDEIYRQSLPK